MEKVWYSSWLQEIFEDPKNHGVTNQEVALMKMAISTVGCQPEEVGTIWELEDCNPELAGDRFIDVPAEFTYNISWDDTDEDIAFTNYEVVLAIGKLNGVRIAVTHMDGTSLYFYNPKD